MIHKTTPDDTDDLDRLLQTLALTTEGITGSVMTTNEGSPTPINNNETEDDEDDSDLLPTIQPSLQVGTPSTGDTSTHT